MKRIFDPIHRFIELDTNEIALLDTAPVQRLRRLRQLGLAYLAFPAAEHSRFGHALGAHFYLGLALFAAHVEYLHLAQAEGNLQHERAFANARLTANQHDGAGHEAAAEHAVQLAVGGYNAGLIFGQNITELY